MSPKHQDEIGVKAAGGTELQRDYLYKHVDNSLLEQFQIVISRCRELEDKPRLYWVKDLHTDPEVQKLRDPNFLNNFKYIIHNSDWQRNAYHYFLNIPFEKQHVLKNAIEPLSVHLPNKYPAYKNIDKVKLIYSSTPQRGLSILYSVFDELYKEDKNIELNVFSSFDIYGHHQRNIPFEPLFEMCRKHEGINYYGSVPHDEVMRAMVANHIMAYPSLWEETSCITAMENASAGNLIVTNNLGALPETTCGYALMYDYTTDLNEHAKRFYYALKRGIELVRSQRSNMYENYPLFCVLEEQKRYVDTLYSWRRRKEEWTRFLTEILSK